MTSNQPADERLEGNTRDDGDKICHRSYCLSARNMGLGRVPLASIKEAKEQGFRQCRNCQPFEHFVVIEGANYLHLSTCLAVRNSKPSGLYESVREAVWERREIEMCPNCVAPGLPEYVERLRKALDEEP